MNIENHDKIHFAAIAILAVMATSMAVYMAIDGAGKVPPPQKFFIDTRLECQVSSYGTITCKSLDKVKAPVQNRPVI